MSYVRSMAFRSVLTLLLIFHLVHCIKCRWEKGSVKVMNPRRAVTRPHVLSAAHSNLDVLCSLSLSLLLWLVSAEKQGLHTMQTVCSTEQQTDTVNRQPSIRSAHVQERLAGTPSSNVALDWLQLSYDANLHFDLDGPGRSDTLGAKSVQTVVFYSLFSLWQFSFTRGQSTKILHIDSFNENTCGWWISVARCGWERNSVGKWNVTGS